MPAGISGAEGGGGSGASGWLGSADGVTAGACTDAAASAAGGGGAAGVLRLPRYTSISSSPAAMIRLDIRFRPLGSSSFCQFGLLIIAITS